MESYTPQPLFEFATATRIIFGCGVLQQLPELAAGMGRSVLLATGSRATTSDGLLAQLAARGLQVELLQVHGEPTLSSVAAAAAHARAAKCDVVIGIGGGSVLDTAKAVAALLTNSGDLLDYVEVAGGGQPLANPAVACIAVPTTAGTGSEVARGAIVIVDDGVVVELQVGHRRHHPSVETIHRRPGGGCQRMAIGHVGDLAGGQAQRNPQPVLLRLADLAVLPNRFRANVKECFVVGAGYGDVSSERAYIRTEALSCVTRDGRALDIPVKGYVAGEDGKAGMRGRLVSKQGQILANALLAGVASGIGHAFQMNATTLSVSPLGATGTVDPDKQLQAGLGTGVGKALDRLAQYYISLTEKVFPVIEIDAGRTVDVVITQGISLQGPLDAAAEDRETFPQLTERTRTLRRNNDDHQ